MAEPSSTVVKLGGSLLHSTGWPSRLTDWLSHQPPGTYFVIVGGGLLVDALRDLDKRHGLSQTELHWRCIRLLDATFEIATELLPEVARIESIDELRAIAKKQPAQHHSEAFCVRISAFYNREYLLHVPTELHPECSWKTTSDSLALFLASLVGAKRCVLLKTCSVEHITSLNQAIEAGVVDSECIRFQSKVPTIELKQI